MIHGLKNRQFLSLFQVRIPNLREKIDDSVFTPTLRAA
ncbi:hypothetical protein PATSB16_28580 [Pandoraea thiooxydans]|nr:hypothetical protein PATSB16_28580 [Pandoraea thiooxydans]